MNTPRIKRIAEETMAWRFRLSGQNEVLVGGDEAERINGGKGSDVLFGGGGPDVFVFGKGDGVDFVLDFQSGVDKLEVHSSPRQISMTDTDAGTEVFYSAFGQNGPDHFLLVNVHHVAPSDFVFQ